MFVYDLVLLGISSGYACVRRPGACMQLRSAGADLVIDPYKRELFGVRRVNSVGM